MKVLTFDLETTGLDFDSDEMTQFACMKYDDSDGKPTISEFQFFLPTRKELSEGARDKTGYTNEMLVAESPFDSYISAVDMSMKAIAESIASGAVICGMNVSFDFTMLRNNFERTQNDESKLYLVDKMIDNAKVYDTYVMDKYLRKNSNGESRRLVDLASYYDTPSQPNHDAKYDVRATFEVMYAQLKRYSSDIPDDIDDICDICKKQAVIQRKSLNSWLSKKSSDQLYEGFPILRKIA